MAINKSEAESELLNTRMLVGALDSITKDMQECLISFESLEIEEALRLLVDYRNNLSENCVILEHMIAYDGRKRLKVRPVEKLTVPEESWPEILIP